MQIDFGGTYTQVIYKGEDQLSEIPERTIALVKTLINKHYDGVKISKVYFMLGVNPNNMMSTIDIL